MQIKIKIVGVSALLLNRYTPQAAELATQGSRGSSAAAERGTPMEQAKARLYTGLAGGSAQQGEDWRRLAALRVAARCLALQGEASHG